MIKMVWDMRIVLIMRNELWEYVKRSKYFGRPD